MGENLHKIFMTICAIPNTLYFNFKYFSFADACKFPVIVSHRVKLRYLGGIISFSCPIRTNMVHLGFYENKAFDNSRERMIFDLSGEIIIGEGAYFGNGIKLVVSGTLKLGNNFQISGNTQIICEKDIEFGDDVLIGWHCLIMDCDGHKILDSKTGEIINENKKIYVGNRVWVGARTTLLKGTVIADDTVIASNSHCSKCYSDSNVILAGIPAKVVKDGIKWIH